LEGKKLRDLTKAPVSAREATVSISRLLTVPIKVVRSAQFIELNNSPFKHGVNGNHNILRDTKHRLAYRKKRLIKLSTPILALSFAFISVTPLNAINATNNIKNIKDQVLFQSNEGVNNMKLGVGLLSDAEIDKSKEKLTLASENFQSALNTINMYGQYQSISTNDSSISEGYSLIKAASLINDSLLISLSTFSEGYALLESDSSADFIEYFKSHKNEINTKIEIISNNLYSASSEINSVKSSQYFKYKDLLNQFMPSVQNKLEFAQQFISNYDDLLGFTKPKNILILFLNNAELRPGGGFIGSYATGEVKNGHISGLAIDTNIIKKDATFGKLYRVQAPYPLSKVSNEWYMRDSNWDVNYNESAKTTAWFYNKEGGPAIDMQLSIDSTFIANLLTLTGPIKLDDNLYINDQNFNDILTYNVENQYWKDNVNKDNNEPKTIIKEIYPKLLESVSALFNEKPKSAFDFLSEQYKTKHLNFSYTGTPSNIIEESINKINEFDQKSDFIMINNANGGGLKSSLSVKQNVEISIEPKNDKLYHRVEIVRTHEGTKIWPDGDNHNYIRLAVPTNATLISGTSSGLEAGVENNNTLVESYDGYKTFGLWMTTPVGESTNALFEYETTLPKIYVKKSMNFIYYKQTGSIGDYLNLNIYPGRNFSTKSNSINKFIDKNETFSYTLTGS
jgi:hypothetical protein